MNTIHSKSFEQTEKIAFDLAQTLNKGDVIALFGEMGAGKTAFVRGLAKGLGLSDRVSSPTFAIVHDYSGQLIHFDMYRIDSWDSLYSTGYYDYLDMNAIIVIEWSENIENALPPEHIRVEINKTADENERIITIGKNNELNI